MRRIVIEEVEPSKLEIPGQKPSAGGWRISDDTAKEIPEDVLEAVILTIAGVVQQKLLKENARLRGENMVLKAPLSDMGMCVPAKRKLD